MNAEQEKYDVNHSVKSLSSLPVSSYLPASFSRNLISSFVRSESKIRFENLPHFVYVQLRIFPLY